MGLSLRHTLTQAPIHSYHLFYMFKQIVKMTTGKSITNYQQYMMVKLFVF